MIILFIESETQNYPDIFESSIEIVLFFSLFLSTSARNLQKVSFYSKFLVCHETSICVLIMISGAC